MSRRDQVGSRIKAARAGLVTGLPHGTKSLKVGDKTYAVLDLDKAFAAFEKLFEAASAAHAALDEAVDRRDGAKPAARELLADFKAAIVALLGRRNPDLALFGINPERPRKKGERKPKTLKPAA